MAVMSPDDAMIQVRAWAQEAPHDVEFLPSTWDRSQRAAAKLGLSFKSTLGALVHHTGGLLVDGGWLRIYGAGHPRLPRAVHLFGPQVGFGEGLLIADDAVGGFFAWFDATHTVHYLSPDTARWENLELGYDDWLGSVLGDGLAGFYAELRWEGWAELTAGLAPDQGLRIDPPPRQAGPPLGERSMRPTSMVELWSSHPVNAGARAS